MKKVFISAISRIEPDYSKVKELVENIPEKKLAICYSNQFIEIAKKIKAAVDKEIICEMQVLGCSNPKFSSEVEAILIVGQGNFHPVSLAYETKLPVYVLENESIRQIEKEDVEKLEKKEKGAYLKYLHSKKVGLLISTKPGQQRLNEALKFKNNLKDTLSGHKNLQAGKKGYLFIANDLNALEFENFPIDFWVNTACPRMDLNDIQLINLDKLKKLI